MMNRLAAAALLLGALAGCTPAHTAAPDPDPNPTSPNTVVATSLSRSNGNDEHYAECATNPAAAFGDYRVPIPAARDNADDLPTGAPCPVGPREPMPAKENPELYAELQAAMSAPAPYRGGDAECSWEADTPQDAQAMAASCASEH